MLFRIDPDGRVVSVARLEEEDEDDPAADAPAETPEGT